MKRTTKKTLAASLLSLLLCVAMLIGSTYAWFSDTASTGDVKITAGNLDVEVTDENGDPFGTEPNNLIDTTKCDPNKVEPGMMLMTKAFKIKNAGSLALVYTLTIDATTTGSKDLSKVIKMKVVKKNDATITPETDTLAARQALWNKIGATESEEKIDELTTGVIYPESGKGGVAKPEDSQDAEGSTDALVAILFWDPTENDNEYNLDDISGAKALKVDYTLNVFATQTPAEKDSFGEKYDTNLIVSSATAYSDLVDNANGKPVNLTLGSDIAADKMGTVYGGSTIDGNGHTLSAPANDEEAAFVVLPNADTTTTISNITIENTGSSGRRWGLVIGNDKKDSAGNVVLENCTIKADGAFALGINNGANVVLKNCVLEGWSALEVADNSQVLLQNCKLIGTNTYNDSSHNHGTIMLYGTKCTVMYKNCEIIANQRGTALQARFGFGKGDDGKFAKESQIMEIPE